MLDYNYIFYKIHNKRGDIINKSNTSDKYFASQIAERIKSLAEINNTTIKELLIQCGLNKNTIFTMQTRGSIPQITSLIKIADFFELPLDFLLGRDTSFQGVNVQIADTLINENVSSFDEPVLIDVIRDFRIMSPKNQQTLRNNQIKLLEAQQIEFESNGDSSLNNWGED